MEHLISKQVFELQVADAQGVPEFQHTLSRHFWDRMVPALERLFDRLSTPNEVIRLPRLEIDLGSWSANAMVSDAFIEQLVAQLEEALTETLQMPTLEALVQPLRADRFDLWLFFLGHGYLPARAALPSSPEEWHQQVFETLAAEDGAVQRLRSLITKSPPALERLLLQFDEGFRQQIVMLLTSRNQDQLADAVRDMATVIDKSFHRLSSGVANANANTQEYVENISAALLELVIRLIPSLKVAKAGRSSLRKRIRQIMASNSSDAPLSRRLASEDFWELLLREFAQPDDVVAMSRRIVDCLRASTKFRQLSQPATTVAEAQPDLERVRYIELTLWRILLDEVIIKGRQCDVPAILAHALRHESMRFWQPVVLQSLGEKKGSGSDIWEWVADAIKALPEAPISQSPEGETTAELERSTDRLLPVETGETEPLPPIKEDIFYVPNAGVILLHTFLAKFFQKLELTEDSEFTHERSRQRAVSLLHHLATGEQRSSEFRLVLPKFLCGMPLNAPVDHAIAISKEEQAESDHLLTAAIEHWGALGNSSPEALREGFLQRDGKLEKLPSGWLLQVERKTLDVLLDRLTWGIGMVKLPWMEELLRVEWR